MPYVITFLDDPGTERKRQEFRPLHLEHVIRNAHRIIASGGLFADDGQTYTGGLIILDTDHRQEAIDYIESDPFFLQGIFSQYTVHRWRKAIFDHQRVTI
ncbi:YciI family protein [Roseomonas sp. GC11]|uniref:YciI family protein n=1 Tax=Roseomonas sp. GC11 TaxID=2950546 RepID=UPI00210AA7E6|nr:YciI family protein [Roseomonas sp. GC11]MCQ4159850.1 YciI family protein [Roseomonas sp. GC11]